MNNTPHSHFANKARSCQSISALHIDRRAVSAFHRPLCKRPARDNIRRAQQNMKKIYDRSAREPKFMVGDRVWVYNPKTKKGLSRKLTHQWHGPFRIVEKCSPLHFRLRTCDNRRVSVNVHANRMKPYYDPYLSPLNVPNNDIATEPPIPAELPENSLAKPRVTLQPAATQSVPAAPPKPTETVNNIEKNFKTAHT